MPRIIACPDDEAPIELGDLVAALNEESFDPTDEDSFAAAGPLLKLDCDGAFAVIAPFLEHSDFFVRWHVMKELLGIDAEAALPHLRHMAARDPHPDTRRAARSVLDRLETPQPQRAA